MYRLMIPLFFCFAAQVAGAQCLSATTATPAAAPTRAPAELIKTAAAGTRDAPDITASPKSSSEKVAGGEERRRPAGGAMLLAALALMSGIALRRASASDE